MLHWLAVQDTALFRWINTGWTNPVLDSAMPFFSGNRFFMPTAILIALVLLWRGRLRGFICVATVLVAITLGDGFLYPAIKDAVGRSRPNEAMTDAILRVGNSQSNGMPSAHAANWMCLAAVTFAFYRRSAWITLPAGTLVALSRVYNGVHYPSDVLAGMLLGAGCGLATLWALNAIWIWVGRRWFPLWWDQFPSLLSPGLFRSSGEEIEEPQFRPRKETGPAPARHDTIDAHWMRLGYIVIFGTLIARLLFLASGTLQLSPDEAYQWHWSKHLALSYFSKPPMIAWTQFLGTTIWGDNEFGVRFFSPVIAAMLGVVLLRFLARQANARAGFFLLLILTTTPMIAGGAILMTVDPLSVLFWTLAMLSGWKAVQEKSTTGDWAMAGLWMGLGFLSKYTALFQLLCWAVFFWLWPASRKQLKRPGPWVALLILAVCSLPLLIWNHQHGWVTVAHVAEDAGAGKAWKPTVKYLGEFLGAEMGLLNPVFFIATVWASIALWKRGRRDPRLVYLFSMGAPVFLVYLLFSFKSRVLPNWIAPSVIPLFCAAVIYWDTRLRLGQTAVRNWLYAGLIIGGVVVLFAHDTRLVEKAFKVSVPPKLDPLRRVRAWPETARAVLQAKEQLELEGPEVFIIGDHYGITSEISFYYPDSRWMASRRPFIFCRSSDTPRNQFHMWPGYENRFSQNAVFVRELGPEYKRTYPAPPALLNEFESVTELRVQPIFARREKLPMRHLQIFVCRGLKQAEPATK